MAERRVGSGVQGPGSRKYGEKEMHHGEPTHGGGGEKTGAGGKPPLRMIAWELTRNCNLNCVHCRARASCGPFEGELTTDEWLNVIDQTGRYSFITFTGGEVFVRKDFMQMLEYACSKRPCR